MGGTSEEATMTMINASRWMSSRTPSTKLYGSLLTITPTQMVTYAQVNSLPPISMLTFTKLAVETPRANASEAQTMRSSAKVTESATCSSAQMSSTPTSQL